MQRFKKIRFDSLLFLVIIIVFIIALKNDLSRLHMLNEKSRKIHDNISYEIKKQAILSKKLNDLKKEETIEKIARQKLGLIKAGESAYKIIYSKKQ